MNIQTVLRVMSQLRRLRKQASWTRQELEAHQARAFEELRRFAYTHSPFYRRFHVGLMDRPLSDLPILTKSMMMEHFDELVTDRSIHLSDVRAHMVSVQQSERYLGRYWIAATSGSTGQPGIFLFNGSEWATVIASFGRGQEWGGLKVDLRQHHKMAVVSSTTPHHMSHQVGTTVQSPFISTLRLAAVEPLPDIIKQLNDFQPDILIAYASMARILAEEQHAGRLYLEPLVIFTSSEVLTVEARQRIESIWGKILFNEYAATEVGGLGAECDHHVGMHLFEDLAILEVVDEHYRPVPPGAFGDKVLLTSFINRTQPLLRYELNDSLRLAATDCPSGRAFRLIDSIQGRTEDTLCFADASKETVAIHPTLFHQTMDSLPVSGWQIVQDTDKLTILLSGLRDSHVGAQLERRLREAFAQRGVVPPEIVVQQVESIPKTASGKAPLIKSNVSHAATTNI